MKVENGWIALHRKLLDKPIWSQSTPEQKTILITLLLMANHAEAEWEWKGKKFVCAPGQFVTSLPSIASKAGNGITIQNVRTALVRFEKYEFLTDVSTRTGRLITICNWEYYQQPDNRANRVANRPLTDHQQTANRQLTVNNNDNKNNNDKQVCVTPTLEEIKNYCQERKNNVDPERFFDHYESIGWLVGKNPMRDWKAAIRKWERDEPNHIKKKQTNSNVYIQSNSESIKATF